MKVLIVDDEPLAREGIRLMLESHEDISDINECCDGIAAIAEIPELNPDLVFLDINMPGASGFDVIEAIEPERLPHVIFLTAYDEFAIDAFRVNALDYLLKPVSTKRLAESLERVRASLSEKPLVKNNLDAVFQGTGCDGAGRIVLRTDGYVHFLRPEEVIWIQAEGDYVTVHTKERSHLVRETMKNMEEKLSARGFQRIHRSSIVNLNEISKLVCNDNGDYDVVLRNHQVLKLSRTYREALYQSMTSGTF